MKGTVKEFFKIIYRVVNNYNSFVSVEACELRVSWASQVVLVVKNLPANAGDVRDGCLIPGLGRSPREGNDPLQ